MAAFFLFLLVLIFVIFFIILSLVGGILRGILRFFGIGSNRHRSFSYKNSTEEHVNSSAHQSREGAIRMRKFKNTAEDTDYEIIEN